MRRFWRGLGRRAAALLARLGLLQPGKIMYIGGSGTLPPPLTREEEAQVIARLEQGDEEARQTLIERNLRLVVYIARRFENTGVNLEDLISIGTIGLIMRPIEADVDRQLLRQALERLEPREKQIITLRFGLDGRQERTQKEVADQLGISQSYISRLEKRIIARLKKEILRMM